MRGYQVKSLEPGVNYLDDFELEIMLFNGD